MIIAGLLVVAAYAIGSLPICWWLGKIWGVDILAIGSGNMGATNLYRALGIRVAAVGFGLDVLKGFIPVWVAVCFSESPWVHVIVGLVAVIGHMKPVWIRGGKGVATGLGMIAGLSPLISIVAFLVGILVIWRYRLVAPVSIAGSILVPAAFWVMGYPFPYKIVVTVAGCFVLVRHRANMVRLFRGEENRI